MGPVIQFDPALRRVDADHPWADDQIDVVVQIKLGGTKWHPIFGGGAGEVVLRQIGPVDWRFLADESDRVDVAQPSQGLGGGSTGRPGADDHHRLGVRGRRSHRSRHIDGAGHVDPPLALAGLVNRDRVEGGRSHCFAGGEVEDGMVPGTVDSLTVGQTVCKWSAVVGALATYGPQAGSGPDHDYGLTIDMPCSRNPVSNGVGGKTFLAEIGSREFEFSTHVPPQALRSLSPLGQCHLRDRQSGVLASYRIGA